MIKNLRVGTKIALSFAITIGLALILSLTALSSFSTFTRNLNGIHEDSLKGTSALVAFTMRNGTARVRMRIAAAAGGELGKKNASDAAKDLELATAALNEYGKSTFNPADKSNFEKLSAGWKDYCDGWKELESKVTLVTPKEAMVMMDKRLKPVYLGKVEPALNEMIAFKLKSGDQLVQEASQQSQKATTTLVITLMAFISFVVVIAVALTKSIVRPLNAVSSGLEDVRKSCAGPLMGAMQALADGNLTCHVEFAPREVAVESSDEIGVMAQTFNETSRELASTVTAYNLTRDELSKLIRDVRETARDVSGASINLAAAAQESGSASNEIAVGSERLAHNATSAASTTQLLSNCVSEVEKASGHQLKVVDTTRQEVERTSQEIEQMAVAATKMQDTASSGMDAVNSAVSAIETMRKQIADSADQVNELDLQGKKIGVIIQTITQIAEQTNLLALNAAIEAARAGEQGRGFAVVAEEVRKLAEGSRQATGEIGSLVSQISGTVNQTVEAIRNVRTSSEVGVERSRLAGVALKEIVEATQSVAQSAKSAKANVGSTLASFKVVEESSAKNQAEVETMNSQTHLVNSVIDEVASISQEAAASAEELSATITEVATSASRLSDVSAQLDGLVSRFQLDSDQGRFLRVA